MLVQRKKTVNKETMNFGMMAQKSVKSHVLSTSSTKEKLGRPW
jgi:hypothetical protein